MRKSQDKAEDLAKLKNRPALSMERPANGLPEDFREHTRLMCDLIALAFQTDKTRVASLLLARDLSALYYPFLDVKDGHHAASHNNLSDGYERISRFHLSQLAYLATKLDAMPEGDGTVLDNSCLMFLSNLWQGRLHNSSRLPVVLAGGLGGTLETGRSLDYLDAGDENRKMCSLYLGIHGSHGHHARSVRRRRHAPGEFLAMTIRGWCVTVLYRGRLVVGKGPPAAAATFAQAPANRPPTPVRDARTPGYATATDADRARRRRGAAGHRVWKLHPRSDA